MFLKLIDNKMRQAFSNSAYQYEVLANLQKEIARELVKKIAADETFSHILDVGMGTGALTNRLCSMFPEAKVVGIDLAEGMLQEAKKKDGTFLMAQANAAALPFKPGTFDVITSNLAYQWVDDLPSAFQSSYAALKPGGKLCCTIFGRNTLEELFLSLEKSGPGGNQIKRLPSKEQIIQALAKAGFQDVDVSDETVKAHFEDMMALIKWLKMIGANIREKDIFVGRDLLARANAYYKENFGDQWGGVAASYEIIWVNAIKEEN